MLFILIIMLAYVVIILVGVAYFYEHLAYTTTIIFNDNVD